MPTTRTGAPGARTVLLVDDDSDVQAFLREFLTGLGLEVCYASSAEEALQILGDRAFGAVVSDVDMPGLDGFRLHAAACKLRPALAGRFVFVTGGGHERLGRFEGCPVLAKPLVLASLKDAVLTILDEAR